MPGSLKVLCGPAVHYLDERASYLAYVHLELHKKSFLGLSEAGRQTAAAGPQSVASSWRRGAHIKGTLLFCRRKGSFLSGT